MKALVLAGLLLFSFSAWAADSTISNREKRANECSAEIPLYSFDQCNSHLRAYGEILVTNLKRPSSEYDFSLIFAAVEKVVQEHQPIILECWSAYRELNLTSVLSSTDRFLTFARVYRDRGKDQAMQSYLLRNSEELLSLVIAYNNGRQSDPLAVAPAAQ